MKNQELLKKEIEEYIASNNSLIAEVRLLSVELGNHSSLSNNFTLELQIKNLPSIDKESLSIDIQLLVFENETAVRYKTTTGIIEGTFGNRTIINNNTEFHLKISNFCKEYLKPTEETSTIKSCNCQEIPIGRYSFNFGIAIDKVKKGKMMQRKGWNGKDMFIFMRPSDILSPEFICNIKSLPESVKSYLKEKGQPVEFLPYLCMFTADKKIVNGWLASQTDMLANDWGVAGELDDKL